MTDRQPDVSPTLLCHALIGADLHSFARALQTEMSSDTSAEGGEDMEGDKSGGDRPGDSSGGDKSGDTSGGDKPDDDNMEVDK